MAICSRRGVTALVRSRSHFCRAGRSLSTTSSLRDASGSTSKEPQRIDVQELLSRPTWSIKSLLSSSSESSSSSQVTPTQLRHLLRLSALPPPSSPEEESEMLATLSSQLHFVREIQKVDTTDIRPLQSLRDETEVGAKESEIGLSSPEMQQALGSEQVKGRFHKRIRRIKDEEVEEVAVEDGKWDVLTTASKRTGRYFVVEGGKNG